MIEILFNSDYEFFPIINIITQVNILLFIMSFIIGFTIKKLIHFMKGGT